MTEYLDDTTLEPEYEWDDSYEDGCCVCCGHRDECYEEDYVDDYETEEDE